jgi:hypothetical protein
MSETIKIQPFTQVPRITISFDEKVNKGNYESEGVFVSGSFDLPEGTDVNSPEFIKFSTDLATQVKLAKDTLVATIKGGTPAAIIKPPSEAIKEPASKPKFTPKFGRKQ